MRALAACVALVGCTPAPRALPGFESVSFVAAIERDAAGAIVAGSEVRALGPGLDVLSNGPVTLVGWSGDALGGLDPDPGEAVRARRGCEPVLPTPVAALDLELDRPLDPAAIPPLAASWADGLCDPTAFERRAYRVRCAEARCPWSATPTGRCTFTLAFEGCLAEPLDARIDPSGALCATSASGCAPAEPEPPALSSVACAPDRCTVDAFDTPDDAPITVESLSLLDVPRFVPGLELTGNQGELPPSAHLVGYTHDVAIVGDRALVSTSTGAARTSCLDGASPSVLHAIDLASWTRVRTASAASCLALLAAIDDGTAVGLSVRGERFEIGRVDRELRADRPVELDDRAAAGPGEPPLSRTDCSRPTELVSHADRLYVVVERRDVTACLPRVTTIHVLDRRTLRPIERHTLPIADPWRAKLIGGELWIADAESLVIERRALPSLQRIEAYSVPIGLGRRSVFLADFDLDAARDDLVVATTRNQPALRRSRGPGDFADRAFFLPREADPVGVWAQPFAGELGLVLVTPDAEPDRFATRAALYDRARFEILPASVPAGFGPPRRMIADGRGGLIALMPWEATLIRLRPR